MELKLSSLCKMDIDGTVDLTEMVAATHDAPQSASSSATENTQLCWKCQALLNSQYPDEVVYKEKDERIIGEGKTLGRTLKTSKFTKTAQEGCPLCQHLMHIMGASMRDSLHRFRRKGLVYEHALHLKEGNPGCLSMIVTSDNIVDELDGDEIKCFTDLYPISGKFMSKTRTKTFKPF
jgi:hypothetical protein